MNLELKQNSDVVLTKIERTLVIKVQLYVRMPLLSQKLHNSIQLTNEFMT